MTGEKNHWLIVLSIVAGFIGGCVSNYLFSFTCLAYANKAPETQVISAQDFQLLDNNGQITARWTSCQGSPCLNFYDSAGRVWLQMGLYGDGLPFIGLFDKDFHPKALLRLFGNNEAPVLVMKNNNQDRLIMGLDLANSVAPFLVYFDRDGRKHLQFGSYEQ